MDLHQLDKIVQALESDVLPGEDAHMLLSPYGRSRSSEALTGLNKPPKVSAVMVIVFPKDGKLHNVLIRRPEYSGVHSSQIAFPGGKQEVSDRDLFHTASRESHEEVGVPEHHMQLIGELTPVYIPPSNFLVHPFVSWVEKEPTFIPDPREVARIIEYPLESLLDDEIIKVRSIKPSSVGYKINAPYFDIDQEVVWGATALILSEFREIIQQI